MLTKIRDFFDRNIGGTTELGRHSIEIATAALLVEVTRVDANITDAERAAVLVAVRSKFNLTAAEADTLFDLAEAQMRQATDYYQFTSQINRTFTAEQKERVLELMWRVAYADGSIDAHEQHLLRKVAALLHVPDRAYIAAKLRARDTAAR